MWSRVSANSTRWGRVRQDIVLWVNGELVGHYEAGIASVGAYNLNIDWRYARAQKPAKLVDSLKNVEKGSQRHPSRHGVQSFRIIADA